MTWVACQSSSRFCVVVSELLACVWLVCDLRLLLVLRNVHCVLCDAVCYVLLVFFFVPCFVIFDGSRNLLESGPLWTPFLAPGRRRLVSRWFNEFSFSAEQSMWPREVAGA